MLQPNSGIFGAYFIALQVGFEPNQAGAIGIIGGADGPTAIFLTSKLAPNLLGAVAISAYSYMALIPVIQPPFMKLLTTDKERVIRMKTSRAVSQTEKNYFSQLWNALNNILSSFRFTSFRYAVLR